MKLLIRIQSVLFFLLLFSTVNATAQKLLTGVVIDAATKNPLPYISVGLKKQLIGTSTNEKGEFDLYIPDSILNDTLVINSLGYKTEFIAITKIDKPLQISLTSNLFDLKEIIIRPLTAADYIRLAMRKVKDNYSNKPFETEAYYRKKTLENKEIINFDEAIFKSYYPNYQDTVPNQHQLLLYKHADVKEIAFMKERRDEKKAKKDTTNNKDKNNVVDAFTGPETLLKLDVIKGKEEFLDTTQLRDFNYEFAPSTTYDGKEILIITFKSRGKIDHVKTHGNIYIDKDSYAIVSVDFVADLIIPILYRPLIFMLGYGVDNPTFTNKVEYQEINGKWYPKNLQFNASVQLTKKHMFKSNEHSDLYIEGIFNINKIKVNTVNQIPLAKRFDAKKKMEEQIHNDEGITWSGLNIIKK